MFKENWQKIREKGKVNFVWKYGVLYWGIPAGIIASILMDLFDQFIENYFTFPSSILTLNFLKGMIIYVIIFAIGGYIYGFIAWEHFERKYKQTQETIQKYQDVI